MKPTRLFGFAGTTSMRTGRSDTRRGISRRGPILPPAARRVFGKVAINCSRKPIYGTLEAHCGDRGRLTRFDHYVCGGDGSHSVCAPAQPEGACRARSAFAPSPPLLHRTLTPQWKYQPRDQQHVCDRQPDPTKSNALPQSLHALGARRQSTPDHERSIDAPVLYRAEDRALLHDTGQLRARWKRSTHPRRRCLVEEPHDR